MRLLRLVGPGEDGTSVIVEAVDTGNLDGERFELSLDDRLRAMAATVGADSASVERTGSEPSGSEPSGAGPTGGPDPAGQSEPRTDSGSSAPTPREIQVRVRAGETAQAVADEAGIPLERVMRFAYPVLQERVRVTDEARRARARRGGDGLLVPFGELVDSRLARHGVDPSVVRWDAYRRADGGWTVTAQFSAHERPLLAKFSFALLNRTVSALDDVAADLLSDRPVRALIPPPPPAEPIAEAPPVADPAGDWDAATPPPRLTAVPNPSRTDSPRAQEASPAVRPPSRRQKAHTRPMPVAADDELFDQDAYDQDAYGQGTAARDASKRDAGAQQPWHEPPLPFEIGTASASAPGRAPRHRAQRSADDADAPGLNVAGLAGGLAGDGPEGAEADGTGLRSVEPAGHGAAGQLPAERGLGRDQAEDAGLARLQAELAGMESSASTGPSAETEAPEAAAPDAESAGAELAVAAELTGGRGSASAEAPGRRSRRSGEKPRMPSWDDILLGVRHKSD